MCHGGWQLSLLRTLEFTRSWRLHQFPPLPPSVHLSIQSLSTISRMKIVKDYDKFSEEFVCQPETLFPCVWTGDKSAWLVPRPREHEKPPWPSSDSVTEEATSTVASINVFSQKSPRSDNILTFKQKIPVYSGTLRAQHRPSPNE